MIDRPIARSFVILGQTAPGRTFRPSDWADRICGVMAAYRPGPKRAQSHLSFSPYVMPGVRGDVRAVFVDGRLNQIEPMAYTFMVGFARDNGLMVEGLEDESASGKAADGEPTEVAAGEPKHKSPTS